MSNPDFVDSVLRIAGHVKGVGLGFDPVRRCLCKENAKLMDKLDRFESAVTAETDPVKLLTFMKTFYFNTRNNSPRLAAIAAL